jgi:ABC-type sulfate transport system substrate-binding protein
MAKRKIEIDDKKYFIWLASEYGQDITEFMEHVINQIKKGKVRGSYPHWEILRVDSK